MKAISLWQPWASAIALGHKRIETRHWFTNYRGPLAIHAAKRWTREQIDFARSERALARLPEQLPLGAIVATCRLVDVQCSEELAPQVSALERLYGNFAPGRFGWILEDITPLAIPVPFTGKQGFFTVPDDLLGEVPA